MPELPEVETVKNGLAGIITGLKISAVKVYRHDLRMPIPQEFSKQIKGCAVTDIQRRAKYILMHLDNQKTVIIHLGMSGTFRVVPKSDTARAPEKHDHVRFDLANGVSIFYHDPRRFGMMDIVDTKNVYEHKALVNLGVEPLTKGLNANYLLTHMQGKNVAIKQAIMDQCIVVGVGNIYASEALYMARIFPCLPSKNLTREAAVTLVESIKKILKKSIQSGGSTLRNYRQVSGDIGDFQSRFAVYDRAGECCPHCVCDIKKTGGVRRIVQGGRSTFYCPVLQEK